MLFGILQIVFFHKVYAFTACAVSAFLLNTALKHVLISGWIKKSWEKNANGKLKHEEKVRRCKSCSKLLIDEKLFCRRCVLEGRNKAGKIGGFIGGIAMAATSAAALLGNANSGNDDLIGMSDDDEDDESND